MSVSRKLFPCDINLGVPYVLNVELVHLTLNEMKLGRIEGRIIDQGGLQRKEMQN